MDDNLKRRPFMGGLAAGTFGLGLGPADVRGDMDGFPETPQDGDPPAGLFLAIEGIEGDSRDERHRGEIEVLSWQLGMHRAVDQGSGRAGGRPQFDSLFIGKRVDKASPMLMSSFATGRHHPQAVLTIQRSVGGERVDWFTITLRDVQVTNVTDFGTSSSSSLEELTLLFAGITVTAAEFDDQGGKAGETEFTWNVTETQR